jgi:hypothetical protein
MQNFRCLKCFGSKLMESAALVAPPCPILGFSLQIEFHEGVWDITLSSVTHDRRRLGARGTGASFDQAWNSMGRL